MHFVQTKGAKHGVCNICGTHGKLTEDHVPPKGTIKFPRMTLHGIEKILNAPSEKDRRGKKFQRGVKFRSICQACNNDYLGGLYDLELIKLANIIGRFLSSLVYLPETTTFSVAPGNIFRAVCGHILSIGVNKPPRGEMEVAMADLVLNPNQEIPDNLQLFYWVYPFWDQVPIRNFSFLVRFGTPPVICSILKFFPLGFMVLWDPSPDLRVSLLKLNDYCVGAGTNQVEIPFRLSDIPPHRFPEIPSDSAVTLHGSDSYVALRWS